MARQNKRQNNAELARLQRPIGSCLINLASAMVLPLLVRLVPAFAGEQSTGCATAVVGGGWLGRQAAGVYAAWRLVVVLVGVCEKWGEI